MSAEEAVKDNALFDDNGVSLLINSISVKATPAQKAKLDKWLRDIATVPAGFSMLAAIYRSQHTLTIRHHVAARLSAGRTIAPMTSNLTNGVGASVEIILDLDMDDQGTHVVFDAANLPLEFTAVQNIYHELAHAMHQMRGTWRYFASEKQAIEEENVFRYQWALKNNVEPRLRFRKKGFPIQNFSALPVQSH